MSSFIRLDLGSTRWGEGAPPDSRFLMSTLLIVMRAGLILSLVTWDLCMTVGGSRPSIHKVWPRSAPESQAVNRSKLERGTGVLSPNAGIPTVSHFNPPPTAGFIPRAIPSEHTSLSLGPHPGALFPSPFTHGDTPRMESANSSPTTSEPARNTGPFEGFDRAEAPPLRTSLLFDVAMHSHSISRQGLPPDLQVSWGIPAAGPAISHYLPSNPSQTLAGRLGDTGNLSEPILPLQSEATQANVGPIPGELFKPATKKLPYFRVCTSNMITPIPFRIPGTRSKACTMACQCDDGDFGIGLYTTRRLTSLCTVAAESICPWQLKTISPSSPAGIAMPLQLTNSQIVACRLLESRSWE